MASARERCRLLLDQSRNAVVRGDASTLRFLVEDLVEVALEWHRQQGASERAKYAPQEETARAARSIAETERALKRVAEDAGT